MNFEEKQRKAAMGLESLNRMKADKMPSSLQGMRENLKNQGVEPGPDEAENIKKMNRGLDEQEALKKRKKAESGDSEKGEKTTTCPKCGKEVPMGNFCVYCGSGIEKKAEEKEIKDADDKAISKEVDPQEISIDEARAEAGREYNQRLTDEMKNITSPDQMINFLDTFEGVWGNRHFYKSEELKKIVADVLESGDEVRLEEVPIGLNLRDKVKEIMLLEKIKGM